MKDQQPNEQTISINSGKITLEGTLTLPDPDQNATQNSTKVGQSVLLIQDSGPLDRNQNSVQIQQNVLSAIATELASNGVASVRFDKRGCGASEGNFDATGHSDLVADAQAWLDYLHHNSPLANTDTYVLGHGEGSIIAPQLLTANPFLKGQILISPFLENYEIIIRRQAENALKEINEMTGFKGRAIRFFLRLSGDQIAKQRKLIERIRGSKKDIIKIKKQVINAKWIREMVNLDASEIHTKVSAPTLIIGGEKDLQCRPEDVAELAKMLSGPVQSHLFPDLTHILRPDYEKPSTQHYLALSIQDVDPRVLGAISQWLKEQRSSING